MARPDLEPGRGVDPAVRQFPAAVRLDSVPCGERRDYAGHLDSGDKFSGKAWFGEASYRTRALPALRSNVNAAFTIRMDGGIANAL